MQVQNAIFELSAAKSEQLPPCTLPEIVFSGRSNVGKSSLINALLQRKSLARTSATPGKTATINFYKLSAMRLVDLPGYGYAKVSFAEKKRWGELIEGYFHADRDVRLVLQLVDMRHTPTADDFQMMQFLADSEIPFVLILTKADKLNKTERAVRLNALEQELSDYDGITVIPFSTQTGEGRDVLCEILDEVTAD